MEVILLEKVRNLGDLGAQVVVKAGYGRNFLIPQGKAVRATKANVSKFEERRAELELKAKTTLDAAQARAQAVGQLTVTIAANASDEGKLYGSIGALEIARAITDAGQAVEKSEVLLPAGTFHSVGDFTVDVQLHSDIVATVKLVIEASK